MSKIRRYLEEGAIYFVTSITSKRKPIFKDEKYANLLLATIEYFKYYLEYVVLAYVVMFDHFHLLIQPSDKHDISKIMQSIKGNFARRYNQILYENKDTNSTRNRDLSLGYDEDNIDMEGSKHHKYPAVWQQSFYDEMVRDERDFNNKIEYIHNNPVKAELVENQGDYRFSSYHQYNGVVRNTVQVAIEFLE